MKYIVNEDTELLNFLLNNIKDYSRNKIKSLLKYKKIEVNHKKITAFDYKLKKNDTVVVTSENKEQSKVKNAINIIYEDKDIIAINKEPGILTVPSNELFEETLYDKVMNYANIKLKLAKIYIVHRLDKETSGIVIFSKSEKLCDQLQENWNNLVKERKYYAVVEGVLEKKDGTIKTYLIEDANHMVHSTKIKEKGKEAITEYKVINESKEYSLLDINIKTGRKNQIRVHMNDINHPVIGDKKYYSKINPIKRLGLHAYKLTILNPLTNKTWEISTKIPSIFKSLFK